MEKLVIIDGNSLLFRAYFAMQRPMITKDGVYTQGIYGFLSMLNKITTDTEPDYLVVAFDMKAKTFRHEMYDEYKAGRKKTPVELLSEIPLLHEILEAMNITVFEKETYEADDIIGTVTKKAGEIGISAKIITGDKDQFQLITETTNVIYNRKGVTQFDIYDLDKMQERYGLTPTQFIDLKGLMGDSSDNIPGIPGVGEKTGLKLLAEYGTIEKVIENADNIKGKKLKEKIADNANLALLSKTLATINTNVPIDIDFEKLRYVKPDYEKLIAIYKKLEFNNFIRKLQANAADGDIEKNEISSYGDGEKDIKTVSFKVFLDKISKNEDVVFELITDNSHKGQPEVKGIALMNEKKKLYTFDVTTPLDISVKIAQLISKNYRLSGYDLKSSLYSLMYFGMNEFNLGFDVQIAEYLIDPNRSKYTLEKMLTKYYNYEYESEESDENIMKQKLYAIARVKNAQSVFLKDMDLDNVFRECEMPLIEVMTAMEFNGIKIDKNILQKTGENIDNRITELKKEITEEAGEEFNINSPKQLGIVLFENMGINYPKASKNKTGYSTGAEVLEKVADDNPIIKKVLEYRKYSKLKSTYIDGLISLLTEDDKLHPHFNQTVAATGRISCTEPNLQNIPIRDDYGRSIRKAFIVSDDNYTFVGSDYSQIELRILASLSGDENLIGSFNNGEDIHKSTASRVFNIPMDQVTSLDRSRAKAVNFGVIYGMSGFGLGEELGITRREAQKYIDEYFEKHIAVKEYLDGEIEKGKHDQQVRTISGRIRQIPELFSSKYMVRQLGNRLAMNTPIQGSAADVIKIAMIKVYNELKKRKLKSKLILQIHDELIIETAVGEIEEVEKLLKENMETAVDMKVKLICELNTGKTWFDLK